METVRDFIFLGSKISADGDCSLEIKRCLLLESGEVQGQATHTSTLAWKIPWTVGCSPWGHNESDMTEQLN